jgi:hypothetical protein
VSRIVCRFSCGDASAVATKLVLSKATDDREVVITYSDPGSEHPDNKRFLADCERWFGQKVITLPKGKYADTWAVWEGERFITSAAGAPCTGFLKRAPTYGFQRPGDILVMGYTAEEAGRAVRIREQNPEVEIRTPLIEAGLTKEDCHAIVSRAGIELPAMYRLGYHNNNCIGCPKGGKGYWNKIRRDFPDVFERMADLQSRLGPGSALWREADGTPILLADLDPKRGNHDLEPKADCSLLCYLAEQSLETAVQ